MTLAWLIPVVGVVLSGHGVHARPPVLAWLGVAFVHIYLAVVTSVTSSAHATVRVHAVDTGATV